MVACGRIGRNNGWFYSSSRPCARLAQGGRCRLTAPPAQITPSVLPLAPPDRLYFIGRRKQCHLPGQGAINPSVSYVDLVLGWIGGLWPDWEKQWAVLFVEARVCSAGRPGRCCRLTAPATHPQPSYFGAPRQQQHTSIYSPYSPSYLLLRLHTLHPAYYPPSYF